MALFARNFRTFAPMAGAVTAGSLAMYTTQQSDAAKAKRMRPLVVSGPSGVGKGTLINMLLEEHPDKMAFSVSHTTRKPRTGEENGVHYHFTPKEEMEQMIKAGEFVEYAHVHGNIYGTSKAAVEAVAKQGKVCVLDIDVQGAKLVDKANLGAYFVFIEPPSMAELEQRLRGRGTESEEKVQLRLKNARQELAATDLPLWHMVFVNADLQSTYREVNRCVVRSCMQ